MTLSGLYFETSSTVQVSNNDVGLRIDGSTGGNGGSGITIDDATNVQVGGALAEGNNIKNNSAAGIEIFGGGETNRFFANSIHNNGGQGIDIDGDGAVLPVDGSVVPGTNNMETDYCEIISAFACDGTGNTQIGVVTNVFSAAPIEIEIFSNSTPTEAYGEGETFIGNYTFTTVTTPDTFFVDLGTPLAVGTILSSTFTQNFNTSEFGPNYTVTAAPTAAAFTASNETCLGADDGYIAIDAPEAYFFFEAGGASVYGDDTDTLWLAPGTYIPTAQYLNGCSSTGSSLVIDPGPALITTFDIVKDTCGSNTGAIVPLTTTGSPGPFEYSYDGGLTWVTSSLTGVPNGNYTVVITDPITGCLSNDYDIVIDSLHDIVDESFSLDAVFCDGSTVFPYDIMTPGGVWSISSVSGTAGIDPATGDVSGGTVFPEDYEVIYTVGICNEKDTALITLEAGETATLTADDYCAEDPSIVTIVGAIGGTFSFTTPPSDDAVLDGFSGQVYGTPGSSYDLTYTSPGACPAVETIVVNIFGRDSAHTLSYTDTSYCLDVPLQEITTVSGVVLDWYLNDPNTSVASGVIYTPVSLGLGNHTIYGAAIDANGCRSEFDSVTYVILNGGVFDAGDDVLVCLGYTVDLDAVGGGTYDWDTSPFLSDTTIGNPTVQHLITDQYFYVNITKDDGCSVRDSVFVGIRDISECDVTVYNVFSPNNDGLNDIWELDGIEAFPDNIVYIYNRWGDRIRKFENYDNVNVVWDGTNRQNEILPSGTYYYVVEVFGNNSQSGWIQLMK